MATYQIIIDDTTHKTKHLIALIKEVASSEDSCISIEFVPNKETEQALNNARAGVVMKTKSKKEFFERLNT